MNSACMTCFHLNTTILGEPLSCSKRHWNLKTGKKMDEDIIECEDYLLNNDTTE